MHFEIPSFSVKEDLFILAITPSRLLWKENICVKSRVTCDSALSWVTFSQGNLSTQRNCQLMQARSSPENRTTKATGRHKSSGTWTRPKDQLKQSGTIFPRNLNKIDVSNKLIDNGFLIIARAQNCLPIIFPKAITSSRTASAREHEVIT